MANIKKQAEALISPIKEQETRPKAQERALGRINVEMSCKRDQNENTWNFKVKSVLDAIHEGKRICQEHGFRFPQDVVVWEFS